MADVLKLTGKQQRFCREYVIDLNATQAAKRAGYSDASAAGIGYDNLRKPGIAAFIHTLQQELQDRLQVNAQTIVERLAAIGLANVADYRTKDGSLKPLHDLTREQSAAVSAFHTKDGETAYKMPSHADQRAALVDVGRHLGIFEKDNEQTAASAAAAAAAASNPGANIATARLIAYALAKAEQTLEAGQPAEPAEPQPVSH